MSIYFYGANHLMLFEDHIRKIFHNYASFTKILKEQENSTMLNQKKNPQNVLLYIMDCTNISGMVQMIIDDPLSSYSIENWKWVLNYIHRTIHGPKMNIS